MSHRPIACAALVAALCAATPGLRDARAQETRPATPTTVAVTAPVTRQLMFELARGKLDLERLVDPALGVVDAVHEQDPGERDPGRSGLRKGSHLCGISLSRRLKQLQKELAARVRYPGPDAVRCTNGAVAASRQEEVTRRRESGKPAGVPVVTTHLRELDRQCSFGGDHDTPTIYLGFEPGRNGPVLRAVALLQEAAMVEPWVRKGRALFSRAWVEHATRRCP